jgi:hypothetical protein
MNGESGQICCGNSSRVAMDMKIRIGKRLENLPAG